MHTSLATLKDPLHVTSARKPRRRFSGDVPQTDTTKPAPPDAPAPLETQIQPPAIPAHREDIQAPHKFSDEEKASMNAGLLTALNDVEMLQSQKKAAVQDFALRIQNKTNEAKMLRTKLSAGEETRLLRAAVAFDATRGVKLYIHPETGEHIRQEPMQPADWQLPMFKPDPTTGQEAPAAPGEPDAPKKAGTPKPAVAPESSPIGETNVGQAIAQAVAGTQVASIVLDLAQDDWTDTGLNRAFKKAAKAAGWTAMQIGTIADRLKECTTVEAMIDTIRPFVVAAPIVPPAAPGAEDDEQSPGAAAGSPLDLLAPVEMPIEPGFPFERLIGQFRKAALAQGWPEAEIEQLCSQAQFAATTVHDEPEAAEAALKVLAPYISNPDADPTDL